MAKICKPILEYKDIIISTGITPSDYSPPKKMIKRFLRLFKQIDDRRIASMISYPLTEIILIVFLAILANASTWIEIEIFGNAKEKWLRKFLRLENGTGRKYGTDEEIRNLQTLHVFDASSEICLFSRSVDKKTNEIPVAQEVLKTLQLKGCIVSFDALHTQKETIKIIVEKKGDYVGALKGNQGILSTEAEACFTTEIKAKIKSDGKDYYKSSEKVHSQVEIRRFYKGFFDP